MSQSNAVTTITLAHETPPVVVRWMYSLRLDMGGCAEFATGEGFRDNDIAECVGVLALDGCIEEEDGQPVMRRRTCRNGDEPSTSFYRRVLLQLREERRTQNAFPAWYCRNPCAAMWKRSAT